MIDETTLQELRDSAGELDQARDALIKKATDDTAAAYVAAHVVHQRAIANASMQILVDEVEEDDEPTPLSELEEPEVSPDA